MSRLRTLRVVSVFAGALCVVSTPVFANPFTTVVNDNFSTAAVSESQSTVDSFSLGGAGGFTTQNGTNVDILGNIGSIPTNPNMVPFEGICASSGSANCVDLNGTANTDGANPQGVLKSAALSLGAGTYSFAYDLLGAEGYLTSGNIAYAARNITTSTTIIFGNSACIAAPSALNCIYYNSNLSLGATNTSSGNISATGLNVGAGTDYIEFVSNTAGMAGAILTDVNLTETDPIVPEPSTMLLLGSALLGLGGIGRLRARRNSR